MDPEFRPDWEGERIFKYRSPAPMLQNQGFFLFSYFYLIVILEELETNSSSFPLF